MLRFVALRELLTDVSKTVTRPTKR